MRGVTYREFSRLGKKRGWTVDMLAELFKGKIGVDDPEDTFRENLKAYFTRVLSCKWLSPETHRIEDRGDVAIAYRAVIEFYENEFFYETHKGIKQRAYTSTEFGKRACACGCGEAVFDRKKWATPGCKKRLQRSMSVTA